MLQSNCNGTDRGPFPRWPRGLRAERSGEFGRIVTAADVSIWLVAALTIAAILARPRGIPEWVWAVAGAVVLIASTLLPPLDGLRAVLRGSDVYLFLAGVMALAELARAEGVFAWLAAGLVRGARGSRKRLFFLIYAIGVVVTALLSNDTTAVVLTPAVLAALARTDADPLPFLFICAFVANAASFLLPIGNPANLVVFGNHLPLAGRWLQAFGLPALAAVAGTFLLLYFAARGTLRGSFAEAGPEVRLSRAGRTALVAVALSATVLVVAATVGKPVGAVAFVLAILSAAAAGVVDRTAPDRVLRGVHWPIVPLVAGLFVVVAALDRSGALELARNFFSYAGRLAPALGNLLTGGAVALADNVVNNLPVALITGYSVGSAPAVPHIVRSALVAVDLGPNLSVTGSLATLLWLVALRREGVNVTPRRFLRTGALVLLPPLALALVLVR